MITTIILFAWIAIPFVMILVNLNKVVHLKTRILHYRILYRFCAVRDETAMKAIKGEIDEEGRLFRLLYTANATIIHDNKNLGTCFVRLIRELYRIEKKEIDSGGNKLTREIESADEETKRIVMKYVHAIMLASFAASPLILFDKVVRKIKTTDEKALTFASKIIFFPREKRAVARFGSALARAACY